MKQHLALDHELEQPNTLVADIRYAARDNDEARDDQIGEVTHLERREVTLTSSDDDVDFLAEISNEREKKKNHEIPQKVSKHFQD